MSKITKPVRRTRAGYSIHFQEAAESFLDVWANGPADAEAKHRKELEELLKHPAALLNFDDPTIGKIFLCSAQDRDETIFKYLAGHGHGSVDGRTTGALHWAAMNGHSGPLKKLLLGDNIYPDIKDAARRTAISYAAESGVEESVKQLLDCAAVDIDSKDETGATPLWWAVRRGRENIAKLLLARGATIPKFGDNEVVRGILFEAVEKESTTLLGILLDPENRAQYGKHCKWLFEMNEERAHCCLSFVSLAT
ncbi:ankyrin repeat-containing domain protein [Aspergillus crustosus]